MSKLNINRIKKLYWGQGYTAKEIAKEIGVSAWSFQSIEKLKTHWHGVTRIPIGQFTKPYIRKGTANPKEQKSENYFMD